MGKSEEEKEEKPKKMFEIHHIIYDDGEVDTAISEYRKTNTGRGAPGKWRLGPNDFQRRCEEILGDHDQIVNLLTKNVSETDFTSSKGNPVITMVEDVNEARTFSPKTKPKQEKIEENPDMDGLDLNFDADK